MAPLNSIYQIRVLCLSADGTQIGLNVLHYLVTAIGGGGATDGQIAAAFDTALAAAYKQWLPTTAVYRGVGAKQIFPAKLLETTTVASLGFGTAAGAAQMPAQVCGLATLRTALAGKANRGRIYFPFGGDLWTNNSGDLNAPGTAALAILAGAIPLSQTAGTIPNVNTLQLMIYHRKLGTVTNVISCTPSGALATQRRRGNYGRKNAIPF